MLRSRKSSSVDWMEHSVLRGGDTETGFWVEWLIVTETVRCKCDLPDYASHREKDGIEGGSRRKRSPMSRV